jgi:hypothetical protein
MEDREISNVDSRSERKKKKIGKIVSRHLSSFRCRIIERRVVDERERESTFEERSVRESRIAKKGYDIIRSDEIDRSHIRSLHLHVSRHLPSASTLSLSFLYRGEPSSRRLSSSPFVGILLTYSCRSTSFSRECRRDEDHRSGITGWRRCIG